MAVQVINVAAGGGNSTWLGIDGFAGLRVLVAVWDRSGGETASVTTDNPGWVTADFVQIAERVTLPDDGTHRRSVWLFESEVPADIDGNPIVTGQVLDGVGSPVAHSWLAIAIDENEAAGYALVVPTGSADSGTSTTTSQGTGSTGSAPAGDVLLIAVETTKGATTATFTTTDNTPPTPFGGDWTLTVTSGSGNNQRRGSVGYAVLAGQAAQAWSDTVTYGTARTSSAVIAAFVKSAGGDQTTADPLPVDVSFGAPTVQAAYSTTAEPLTVEVDLATPAAAAAYATQADPLAADIAYGTPAVSGASQTTAQPLAVDVSFGPLAAAAAYSTTAEPLAMHIDLGTPATDADVIAAMIVGDVAGPARHVETITGPELARAVTGAALRREVIGPDMRVEDITGPARVDDPTPDGPELGRDVTGPELARTLTGAEI